MTPSELARATVIGSGPNGLAAAIRLAQAGLNVTVKERLPTVGGACSTAELTAPGFRNDRGASVFPMGFLSPFFRSLQLGVPWIEPDACCAHPLDDGSAVMLEHSVEATAAGLDPVDRDAYRVLFDWLAPHFAELVGDLLGPVIHVPKHPLWLARFGAPGLLSASAFAHWKFKGERAKALLAGMAAHSVQSLTAPVTAAVGLTLMACGHSGGWPIVGGGSQILSDLLVQKLASLGGTIELGCEVTELPQGLVLADVHAAPAAAPGGREAP